MAEYTLGLARSHVVMSKQRKPTFISKQGIKMRLAPEQVDEVLQAASGVGEFQTFLLGRIAELPGRHAKAPSFDVDPRLSQALLRGLTILASLYPMGTERGVVEIADELGMSASMAHRYLATLVDAGLVSQSPATREYRLSQEPAPAALDPDPLALEGLDLDEEGPDE